jgi:hypothetical protein
MLFITFTSGNYTEMTKNFITNFKNVLAPCGHRLAIVCIDLQAGENLKDESHDWIELDIRQMHTIKNMGGYNSPTFNHIMTFKPRFALEYLLKNPEIYYVDSDIVFYKDPEPVIREMAAPLIFQQDQEWDNGRLCAGNFYVKTTPETIDFMETWNKEVAMRPEVVDQDTLNDMVFNKRAKQGVVCFPSQKFQRGLDAFDSLSPFINWNPLGRGWWRLEEKVCIHANFVHGAMAGKIEALKSIGSWFI